MSHRNPSSLSPRARRALDLLGDGDPRTTRELARRVGPGFGQAVYELRQAGYCITKQAHPHRKHQFTYRLVARR